MKNHSKRTPIFLVGLLMLTGSLLFMMPSCNYDKYVAPVYNITDTISYTHVVQPIFTSNCAVSGCHATGGIAPDLTAGVSYDNLFLYDLVDTAAPETSMLYQRMTSATKPMPPAGLVQPLDQAKVLAWIKQGGLNN